MGSRLRNFAALGNKVELEGSGVPVDGCLNIQLVMPYQVVPIHPTGTPVSGGGRVIP
jgi:hypothetical protein